MSSDSGSIASETRRPRARRLSWIWLIRNHPLTTDGHLSIGQMNGDQFTCGRHMANTWRGNFPYQSVGVDNFEQILPVAAFPVNGCGLNEMICNVHERTADVCTSVKPAPRKPRAFRIILTAASKARTNCQPEAQIPRNVLRACSHGQLLPPLSSSPRHAEPVDTSASHVSSR